MPLYLLATPLDEALHDEAEGVIALLRSPSPRAAKVAAVEALLIRLVGVGLDYHFHGPARRFRLSPLLMKVIDVAAATTLRALKTAARRVLRGLTDGQLVEVADELEERLYAVHVEE